MFRLSSIILSRAQIFGFIVSLSVCIDQITKRIAEHYLMGVMPQSYFFDMIRLEFVQNDGAFLSLGSNWPPIIKVITFLILPFLLLIAASFFTIFSNKLSSCQRWLVALIVSGGVGNLIDRVLIDGLVTDFLNMGIGPVRTGIFNIADVAITMGTILLVLMEFFCRPKNHPAA